MSSPTRIQIQAAIETLAAAGWRLQAPAGERIRLLSVAQVADLLEVGENRAREIVRSLPGSVLLPGNDLRARAHEVESWLDGHPAQVEVKP